MKRPTTRDKFDNFVDKFDNFANHGGIIFLGVVLIVCIYFFSYRQLLVIDLRDKEVETKPRIEQIWKDGCEEKTFFFVNMRMSIQQKHIPLKSNSHNTE